MDDRRDLATLAGVWRVWLCLVSCREPHVVQPTNQMIPPWADHLYMVTLSKSHTATDNQIEVYISFMTSISICGSPHKPSDTATAPRRSRCCRRRLTWWCPRCQAQSVRVVCRRYWIGSTVTYFGSFCYTCFVFHNIADMDNYMFVLCGPVVPFFVASQAL